MTQRTVSDCVLPGNFLRIGHRGAAGLAPENTMVSFETAVRIGVDMIELDVHATADGRIVVLHDSDVSRTTNGSGRVDAMLYDQVRELDAGHRFSPKPGHFPFRGQGLRIPLLTEMLEAHPELLITVELKETIHDLAIPRVAEILRAHRPERIVVGCQDDAMSAAFRAHAPDIAMSPPRGYITRMFYLTHLWLDRFVQPRFEVIQSPVTEKPARRGIRVLTRRFLDAAHGLQMPVQVWTVDDPNEMIEMLNLGVDGIITNFPDRLNAALTHCPQIRSQM